MRQAAAGRTGQARSAWVPTAPPAAAAALARAWEAGRRRGRSCSPGSACESLGLPGFPCGTREGARPSSRPPACWGPGRSCRGLWSRAGEALLWFWTSQPHLCSQCIPKLF